MIYNFRIIVLPLNSLLGTYTADKPSLPIFSVRQYYLLMNEQEIKIKR